MDEENRPRPAADNRINEADAVDADLPWYFAYVFEINYMKRHKVLLDRGYRKAPKDILYLCSVAYSFGKLQEIQDVLATALYVEDGMSHVDIWMTACAAWACHREELFKKATERLLWEREKSYSSLCFALHSDQLFYRLQWQLCCKLENTRGRWRGEMADAMNKVYKFMYFDQDHDLRAIAPGYTETFAERAFVATATVYKATRDLHGRLWEEALIDRWNMLRSMCGVEKIDRSVSRGNQTQAEAETQAQGEGEWEFVD
ncbi:hypothetical protein CMUS01_05640 [Colletotrichum musicola]|uniref:Uncharacterized protein n=1 Tax=Colletotrichum musicola TaxID=2175873 RepID=A0A8H6KQH1_9PEZI|nr:hypothetical protein CMUS01_05640 [Colletotrichum musicola]